MDRCPHQLVLPNGKKMLVWQRGDGRAPAVIQHRMGKDDLLVLVIIGANPSTLLQQLPGEKAAQVMRQYLLPMFEVHRIRQEEIERHERLGTSTTRKEPKLEVPTSTPRAASPVSPGKTAVLAEMQLSDSLLSELQVAKEGNAVLRQRLTVSETACKELYEKLEAATSSLAKLKVELEQTKQKTESDCASLRWQLQQLEALIGQHQEEQSRLSQTVTELRQTNEELSRKLTVTRNTASLLQHEHEVLTEQVRGLSAVTKDLPTVKSLQDALLFEEIEEEICILFDFIWSRSTAFQSVSKAHIDDIQKFSANLQNECAKLANERTRLLDIKKDLTLQRDRLAAETNRLRRELEETRLQVSKESAQQSEEIENLKKEREEMDKQMKELREDRDKLKQRIARFRARRKMFEAQQRTCKNCGKDYEETENYNWSCRTHHSEYGGEMWWCCGKLGKNAPGCRFSKHESKDDDDELDAEEKMEREAASHCPKDPNPRAGGADVNGKEELRRLEILGNQERSQQRRQSGLDMAVELADKFGYEGLREPLDDEDIFMVGGIIGWI
ncbi:putative ankyrin repeat protein [Toxoplasma gondii GAB2-2007-GAL-DOM2]|uniref:Ankyrin repeat protein n=4 Tax=Toxoplasma gondii TaxID=5811 RepID=V4ZDL4_TOXGV|nr:putative ankyrin repeat protein [Toxoplasma gondii VEG]KFG28534.1 putative ankyrin repeat protein [Toxoplasma gondii p89]KFG32280.1 putative ankyrin repeat protein [Toxoplasma gondii GAB2-2007-GAL-DOM2]KFH01368.1 putative ankyrin repeat protein [Toxoplasma gondii MAS]